MSVHLIFFENEALHTSTHTPWDLRHCILEEERAELKNGREDSTCKVGLDVTVTQTFILFQHWNVNLQSNTDLWKSFNYSLAKWEKETCLALVFFSVAASCQIYVPLFLKEVLVLNWVKVCSTRSLHIMSPLLDAPYLLIFSSFSPCSVTFSLCL